MTFHDHSNFSDNDPPPQHDNSVYRTPQQRPDQPSSQNLTGNTDEYLEALRSVAFRTAQTETGSSNLLTALELAVQYFEDVSYFWADLNNSI